MDVIQQRSRGVGNIGGMYSSAGQAPEEERVDRPEGELPALRTRPGARHVIQYPADLGAGEVRIEQESGPSPYEFLRTLTPEARAFLCRTPVLPDDGAMNRRSAGTLPDDHRLALIGDA